MNRKIGIAPIAGWLIGIIAAVNFAMQHGRRWEFTWYGCPASLIAEDGRHYQDGTEIDPFSLMAMKHGPGPEIWLFVYAIWMAGIVYIIYLSRHMKRRALKHEEEMRRLRELNSLRQPLS